MILAALAATEARNAKAVAREVEFMHTIYELSWD